MKNKYKVSAQTQIITDNTTVMPEQRYSGWMAANQGTATAIVMNYTLQPGEGLSFLDAVPVGCSWDTPIQIICEPGSKVVLTRLQYTESK